MLSWQRYTEKANSEAQLCILLRPWGSPELWKPYWTQGRARR